MDDKLTEADFADSASLGASIEIANSPWVVMKFGGTSVSSAENWQTIARLIRNRLDDGLRPVIVHSALAGVSNRLAKSLKEAAAGTKTEELEAIRTQHYDLAKALDVDGPQLLDKTLHELEQLIAGVRVVREIRGPLLEQIDPVAHGDVAEPVELAADVGQHRGRGILHDHRLDGLAVDPVGIAVVGVPLESKVPLVPAPHEAVFSKSDETFVANLLSRITEREARVLQMRYGLDDGRKMTLKEIGEAVGLTRERVRQIEKEAKVKLESYVSEYY